MAFALKINEWEKIWHTMVKGLCAAIVLRDSLRGPPERCKKGCFSFPACKAVISLAIFFEAFLRYIWTKPSTKFYFLDGKDHGDNGLPCQGLHGKGQQEDRGQARGCGESWRWFY